MAELQSVSVDHAIRQALEARAYAAGLRLSGDLDPETMAARRTAMERHARAIAALPILDARPVQAFMDELNTI